MNFYPDEIISQKKTGFYLIKKVGVLLFLKKFYSSGKHSKLIISKLVLCPNYKTCNTYTAIRWTIGPAYNVASRHSYFSIPAAMPLSVCMEVTQHFKPQNSIIKPDSHSILYESSYTLLQTTVHKDV